LGTCLSKASKNMQVSDYRNKEEETGFYSSVLRDESECDAAMFEFFKANREQPIADALDANLKDGRHVAAETGFALFMARVRRLLGLA